MKRLIALLLTVLIAVACTAPAFAAGFDPSAYYEVQAESAYVVNTDTNVILYEKNSEAPVKAGGLTKLMNVALILSLYEDALDTTPITMPSAVSDYVFRTSFADVRAGETYTLREMLYGMLLPNGNDAAQGTAYVLSGNDLSGWYSQMNALSRKIGATDSVWTDACGIDDGNITTAKDMYLILRYLMDYDAFVEIMGTYQYQMPANTKHANPFWIFNYNKMLSKSQGGKFYRKAMMGGKTDTSGTDPDKGRNTQSMVSWANQDGATYIFSIMNSPHSCDDYGYDTKRPALYETGKLMDWVFDSFAIQSALDTTTPIGAVPVKYSSEIDSLKLYPADDLKTILPADSDSTVTQKDFHLPEAVAAPVKQGDVVGTVTLMLAGEPIGTVELLAGQDVHRNNVLYTIAKLQDFFTGTYFKVVLVLSLLSAAVYSLFFMRHAMEHKHTNRVHRHE